MKKPRVGSDLIEWLRDKYPQRCIAPTENREVAQHYAGKAELAQELIRMGLQDDEPDLEMEMAR